MVLVGSLWGPKMGRSRICRRRPILGGERLLHRILDESNLEMYLSRFLVWN